MSLRGPRMTIGRLKLAADINNPGLLKLVQLVSELGHDVCVCGGTTTFSEQDSLISREFALNGEVQQVVPTPTHVLLVVLCLVPSENPLILKKTITRGK